jgi:micrococcal nuclease
MGKIIAEIDLLIKKLSFGPFWSIGLAVVILVGVSVYALVCRHIPSVENYFETKEVPGEYRVLEVVDGDTLKLSMDGNSETVRLIGIDAPETDTCLYSESTQQLKDLVEDKYVTIQADPSQGERDKYGRLLLYIWHMGTFVNEDMIRNGFAYEYTYDYPYQYQSLFIEAQKDARLSKRGLWGDVCSK